MESADGGEGTIIRGRQRTAVYEALRSPRTGRELLRLARRSAPSMTYQDLRHILRDFERRGLAVCLNSQCRTGRMYVRRGCLEDVDLDEEELELCALVGRATTRLAVLEEVGRDKLFQNSPLTATQVKKNLRDSHPLGLNHVLSALQFLERRRLVEVTGTTVKRDLKIYGITQLGLRILRTLSPPEDGQSSGGTPTR